MVFLSISKQVKSIILFFGGIYKKNNFQKIKKKINQRYTRWFQTSFLERSCYSELLLLINDDLCNTNSVTNTITTCLHCQLLVTYPSFCISFATPQVITNFHRNRICLFQPSFDFIVSVRWYKWFCPNTNHNKSGDDCKNDSASWARDFDVQVDTLTQCQFEDLCTTVAVNSLYSLHLMLTSLWWPLTSIDHHRCSE